ncbi:MAG TPA: RsmE family RNA methyltransferase [Verrucomicrobiae bacterium]
MHRFHLPPEACQGPTLTLADREAHHALHVVRLRRGERVSVLDGAGYEYLCDVREATRESVTLAVLHKNHIAPLPYHLTLLQAMTKGKAFEIIIQKATELGAFRVVPLISERVVSQPDDEAAASKVEKWRWIAIDSIKQCGSAWLPQIEAPLPLKTFLAHHERFELPLVASLQSDRRHLREVLDDFRIEHGRLPRSVGVFVGPEGDFTSVEMDAIKESGALPVTLGPLVLRSDTAAVYALSVLNYELQSPPR